MSYTKTNWVNNQEPAINATNLNKIEQGIYDNDSHIGDLSNLETTAQTDVVNAINENVNNIGDLTALLTTVNTDLVSAINELENNKATKDNTLQYKGYARDVSLDFNDITDSGIYYLANESFSNAPNNYFWSYLIVIGYGFVATQIIVKPVSNIVLFREHSGDPARWTSWKDITTNIYSTNETIIGTWIGGKPLYRKVFAGNLTNEATNYNYAEFFLPTNIETLVKLNGTLKTSGTYSYTKPIPATGTDINYFYGETTGRVRVYGMNKTEMPITTTSYEVIAEYTKTTD